MMSLKPWLTSKPATSQSNCTPSLVVSPSSVKNLLGVGIGVGDVVGVDWATGVTLGSGDADGELLGDGVDDDGWVVP